MGWAVGWWAVGCGMGVIVVWSAALANFRRALQSGPGVVEEEPVNEAATVGLESLQGVHSNEPVLHRGSAAAAPPAQRKFLCPYCKTASFDSELQLELHNLTNCT